MTQAQTITSKAKSNLAFALIDLPEEERRHMAEFYAFCRTVDDIVDEPGMTPRERHDALNRWIEVINGGDVLELTELEEDIIALIQDLELDTTPMLHLIEGCRSDICQQQPLNRDELLDYTYCVACCVGLTSARIMGAGEAAYPYAIALGHALQMVNIIRDVAEDCGKSNRIYLPREDMDRFGYTPAESIPPSFRNCCNMKRTWRKSSSRRRRRNTTASARRIGRRSFPPRPWRSSTTPFWTK